MGDETDQLQRAIKYSVVLLLFTMPVVFIQAYLFPGIIPIDTTIVIQ